MIEFAITFRTKGFIYFWNTITSAIESDKKINN